MNVITILVEKTDTELEVKNWNQMAADGKNINPIEVAMALQIVTTKILQALNPVPPVAPEKGA